ncbi:hypothetical protein O0L34_g15280 [Tuta absoluta]|nr:hypothetical protein O0L34_g15280 [Tuta absoluta]
MAANNYFGFTHGGTQYGAATAGAAYGGQTGYAVAPAATAATYGTQRAAATGYDTAYQAAAATQAAAAHAHAHAAAAAASAYDASKSAYYQQAAAAYPAAAPPTPQYDTGAAKPAYSTPATYAQVGVVSTPYYQQAAAKPAYSTPATYAQTGARAGGGAAKPAYGGVYTATTAAASYPTQAYTAPAAQTPKQTTNRGNTAYDTALYNAATMYVAQQNKTAGTGGGWKNYNKSGVGAGGGGGAQQRRPKPPPKAQQLHYCDVCRISCAGPQTYKEHLEGQKHKKKEAAVKLAAAGASAAAGRAGGGSSLRCELCDVTCTGADAYAAHVRGIKHQKVVKLHTMLGKPIPSTEPTKLGQGAKKTVAGTPKIAFVSSGGLSTVSRAPAAAAPEEEEPPADEEVQPVGQDYIEEIRADDGKPLSFNCKLCDCKFNDPNAKEMHMKGRRHRLQYKKKVQPDLEVKVKPSMHQRKIAEAKAQRMMARDELWARRRYNDGMEDEERAYWEGGMDGPWGWRGPPPHHHPMHHGMGMGYGGVNRRIETSDDRHVLAKHADIYPGEQQLADIQRCVSHTERALKSLSDALQEHKQPKNQAAVKKDEKKEDKPEGKEDGRDNQLFSFVGEGEGAAGAGAGAGGAGAGDGGVSRALKGVMRVGLLAKGLLLSGDKHVRLVVLCHDRPTVTLLKRVAADLPAHLNKVKGSGDEPKYKVELLPAEGAVQVSDGSVQVLVSLTSAVMREPAEGGEVKRDDKDVLPRQKCLDALAALRHAKWFQARAASLQSCVIIIRILRDLCRRIPNWTPLNPYAMELLVSGVVGSAGAALSPGEALRRVMEAVAGGLLLEQGPGLRDPCEKELVDALGNLPPQKREDLTASAQQFLRQIAFRQIHKVLDMEPLPKVKHAAGGWKFPRKRRRSNTDAEADTPNGEGKVVKTEEKADASETTATAAAGKK